MLTDVLIRHSITGNATMRQPIAGISDPTLARLLNATGSSNATSPGSASSTGYSSITTAISTGSARSSAQKGGIAGGTVGGFMVLLILFCLGIYISRRKGLFHHLGLQRQVDDGDDEDHLNRHPTGTSEDNTGQAPLLVDVRGNTHGLQLLCDGTESNTDIVFVHGLMGGNYTTWLDKQSNVYWPRDLLSRDIKNARILTFGYDANVVGMRTPASQNSLDDHARGLVGDLTRLRERSGTQIRNILFVAHSLGGLVVEAALAISKYAPDKHLQNIEEYTRGIVFMGTPHYGSSLADWGTFGTKMLRILKANSDIVDVLRNRSKVLAIVQTTFQSILRTREVQGKDRMIAITCFTEEQPMGIGMVRLITSFDQHSETNTIRLLSQNRRE